MGINADKVDGQAADQSVAKFESMLNKVFHDLDLIFDTLPDWREADQLREDFAKIANRGFPPWHDLMRLRWLVTLYERRLIASDFFPEDSNPNDDPLPDRPGMESAYRILAEIINKNLPPNDSERVTVHALKKWRSRLALDPRSQDLLNIWVCPCTLKAEVTVNAVPQLLKRLPAKGGNRRLG